MADEYVKVKFLRGPSSNLPTTATNGTFYLTTDTNRLYIGDTAGKLQELNQSITTINTLQELDNLTTDTVKDGQFYYIPTAALGDKGDSVSRGNILVVASGTRTDDPSKPNWIQINPDTYYHLIGSNEGLKVNGTQGTIKIDLAVGDTKEPNPSTTAAHSVKGTVSFVEGDNIQLSGNESQKTIEISATDTKYGLETEPIANNFEDGKITLRGTDGNTSSIIVRGGTGVKVQVEDQVTGNSPHKEITISGSNPISGVSNSFTENGQLITTLAVANDPQNPIRSTADNLIPKIKYGGDSEEANNPEVAFESGIATLDVYTIDEVDTKIDQALSGAQAMSYKGVANSFTDINKSDAVPGITYKVAATNGIEIPATNSATGSAATAKLGDLIIAEQDKTTQKLKWAVVPSGDDQFISATVTEGNTSGSIVLKDGLNSNTTLAGLTLQEGTLINVKTVASGKTLSATINHKTPTGGTALTAGNEGSTQPVNNDFTVNVVDSLTKDAYGHVTAATLNKYTFKHAGIPATGKINFSDATDTISYGFTYGGNNAGAASLKLKSDTITFLADSNDSTAHMRTEILWGSF